MPTAIGNIFSKRYNNISKEIKAHFVEQKVAQRKLNEKN